MLIIIGSNKHNVPKESVSRTCEFSEALTESIIAYSINRADEIWGARNIDSVNLVYKFHLFDGVFSIWAEEWSKKFGLKIKLVQPDTANRKLLVFGVRGHHSMIAGNEWADIMHVSFSIFSAKALRKLDARRMSTFILIYMVLASIKLFMVLQMILQAKELLIPRNFEGSCSHP